MPKLVEVCCLQRGDFFVWDDHAPTKLFQFQGNVSDDGGVWRQSLAKEVVSVGNETMGTIFPNQVHNWNPYCLVRKVNPDFSALLK